MDVYLDYRWSRIEGFNITVLGTMSSKPQEIYERLPCIRCQTANHKCHQHDVCIFSWLLKYKVQYSYSAHICKGYSKFLQCLSVLITSCVIPLLIVGQLTSVFSYFQAQRRDNVFHQHTTDLSSEIFKQ